MSQTATIGKTATTVATDNEGYTVVTYHKTQVVKFNDKEVILNNGGWKTTTTKARMNQASNQFDLGFKVIQKNFNWFVEYPQGIVKEFGNPGNDHERHHISR